MFDFYDEYAEYEDVGSRFDDGEDFDFERRKRKFNDDIQSILRRKGGTAAKMKMYEPAEEKVDRFDYASHDYGYGHGGYGHYKVECCPLVLDPLAFCALIGLLAAATLFLQNVIISVLGRRRRKRRKRSELNEEASNLVTSGRDTHYKAALSIRDM